MIRIAIAALLGVALTGCATSVGMHDSSHTTPDPADPAASTAPPPIASASASRPAACRSARPPIDTALATPAAQQLDRTLADAVSQAGIVGLATAVIVDGRVVWTRTYGLADRERSLPLTPQTAMNLASIAKTTIGVSMMRLVAEGRLDLDADINTYLPFRVVNPHHPETRITLRQLATHTSSITDRRDFYASLYQPLDAPRPTLDALLRAYLVEGGADYRAENFLSVAPGASRDYSNLAATLAAYIVERVAGEPFDAHTRRVIFEPLGLCSATWTRRADAPHSQRYAQDPAGTRRIEPYALPSYPEGGLQMSIEDLARYFAMLLSGGALDGVRVIERKALAEMQRFQWTAQHKPADYDLAEGNSGLFWRTKFNGQRVGHGGNDPGVEAEMLTDTEGRVGVVLISNTSLDGPARRHTLVVLDALSAYGRAIASGQGPRIPDQQAPSPKAHAPSGDP
ncbi:MAG: beta-lactamase family protein [Xanthomonadales bacterium]|jgi:CubicO group peptidase (beta-lactamase class C family)|nr:beta-lactamase family protein [Xanthomonadales bacterium]